MKKSDHQDLDQKKSPVRCGPNQKFALKFSLARFFIWVLAFLGSSFAQAGAFETSFGFAFNRTNFGEDSMSWNRRWSLSVGYYFTERSQIELAFQDITTRNLFANYENTTYRDRVYSLSWVQSFLPKDFPVDPYLKAGVGQLNRDASGSFANGTQPVSQLDSLTVILGVGLRVRITKSIGLRAEANSYISGGSISTWKDNVGFTSGFWFLF